MKNYEKFKTDIKNNNDLLLELKLIRKNLEHEDVLTQLFSLCRETFLTQYNAEIFKNENGSFGYFIPNEAFKVLGNHIKEFLNSINLQLSKDSLGEIILILKSYYHLTATSEEIAKKSHVEHNNDSTQFALFGTFYNFTRIDWGIFEKGIKENISFE
ncbi:hypothetical protein [Lysinibacillus antri]|uniref:Uncharacterized protein n=1 Tax=Lysinibacillus antri TaxID=2498145 RepID=A0A432LFL7_9BACI|nr:hypothetical protein [Lysinibacillus antri]RUL56450.1 hypothetical protein EK386_02120 [Lysinibacillus antri]